MGRPYCSAHAFSLTTHSLSKVYGSTIVTRTRLVLTAASSTCSR